MLQAQRLGAHLFSRADAGAHLAHIFSSDLQRARKTAEAVRDAHRAAAAPVAVVETADLREKDFRSSEGKSFRVRRDSVPPPEPREMPETTEEMRARADRFVETHLQPIFASNEAVASDHSVVVVAHGLILGIVLKAILARYSPTELNRLANLGGGGNREYLVAWSNTGYLEALVEPKPPSGAASTRQQEATISIAVNVINCRDHLQGLHRTGGGIGSAKFDDKQKTMDVFFAAASKSKSGESSRRSDG